MSIACDIIKDQQCLLAIVNIIISVFSLIGTLSLIIVYICYSNLRTFAFKLVFSLMISDLSLAIACILNVFRLQSL
jgi:hypothetical protein